MTPLRAGRRGGAGGWAAQGDPGRVPGGVVPETLVDQAVGAQHQDVEAARRPAGGGGRGGQGAVVAERFEPARPAAAAAAGPDLPEAVVAAAYEHVDAPVGPRHRGGVAGHADGGRADGGPARVVAGPPQAAVGADHDGDMTERGLVHRRRRRPQHAIASERHRPQKRPALRRRLPGARPAAGKHGGGRQKHHQADG